jgi:hypothetical protein
MTHDDKVKMRTAIYEHLSLLLNKVHRMFEASGDLTVQQMLDASDILKDIAKADSVMAKACYYESKSDWSDDKRY